MSIISIIVIWALDIIGVAFLFARNIFKKYGVPMSEIIQERKEEKELKRLWREEMG